MMLHNKYQCSMSCGSDKKIFPIDSYSELVSSQAGQLNIVCAPNLIKIGRGVLGDVTYQILRY